MEFVGGFPAQADAVVAHDAAAVLGEIDLPTLMTFGARDVVSSTRFAEPVEPGIAGSGLLVIDHMSHAGLRDGPETFNRATLDFLLRQRDDHRAPQLPCLRGGGVGVVDGEGHVPVRGDVGLVERLRELG